MYTSIAPALSVSFGVIAERFRRAGEMDRAVSLCREGLEIYPDHLSARVTLGCALLEMGRHLEAHHELQAVLKRAPDNLAAIRGLAELHARGIDEQDAHDMQEAHDAQLQHEAEALEAAPERPEMMAAPVMPVIWGETPHVQEMAAAEPVSAGEAEVLALPVLVGALALDDLDPLVEAEPMQFEIEDVIAEAEESFDFGDEFDSSLDLDPAMEPQFAAAPPPEPVPVPKRAEGPIAVLDEWLIRVRARRSELLSEYAAS